MIFIVGFVVLTKVSNKPSPESGLEVTPQTKTIGDINRDGVVDAVDRNYIISSLNCSSTQPCWNKVIGKTSDGDNPIYVFDLDLNKDMVINQKDLDLVK